MADVRRVAFPSESRLAPDLALATYSDAFEAPLARADLTASQIAARSLGQTPAWANAMLRLRDAIVRGFGLKTVGRLDQRLTQAAKGAATPQPGEAFSIFQVMSADDDELVLGIDDTHLDVRIVFLRRSDPARYLVCAWVRTHNLLGRLYMLPVGPFHRLLVRHMMRRTTI